jgi:hypothetical protein
MSVCFINAHTAWLGVMLPFGEGYDGNVWTFPDSCLAALSKIVRATNATIVLSSTWRSVPDSRQHVINEFKRFERCCFYIL